MGDLTLTYHWYGDRQDPLTQEELSELFQAVILEHASEDELLLRCLDNRLVVVRGAPEELQILRKEIGA